MENNFDPDESYKPKGCLVFRGLTSGSPGVAVFTTGAENISDAKKRSVHFSATEDSLIIEEFGYDYHAEVNLAREYIQLSEDDAQELENTGKVVLLHGTYNIVRPTKESY